MSVTPPAPRAARFWFVAALMLVFVLASVQYSFKALRDSQLGTPTRSAILRWRPQLRELSEGTDIYRAHNYPNPPVMGLLLMPLAELKPLATGLTWFYLKVGLTFAALLWTFRLVESPDRPFPVWAKALAVLLSLRPILGDLSHGNVNLFILFLVVAALTLFRNRRDLSAGVVLGLAVACKVTPALFLPYFVWKRAWRAVAGCLLGLVLFFEVVPGLYFGFEANHCYLTGWVEGMVLPFVRDGQVTPEQNNQSLPGLLYRLGTKQPSTTAWDEESGHYVPLSYHNLAEVPPGVVRWGLKGLLLGFAVLVVWSCRTPTADRRDWRLAAEYGVVLLGMLLLSERTWKHHAVTLVVPFAALCYAWGTARVGQGGRFGVGAALAVSAVLMAATVSGIVPDPTADTAGKTVDMAQVYGAYTAAFLVLFAALVVLLRTTRRRTVVGVEQDAPIARAA
jgi:alpha-1,2-mannosyltransferase